MAVTGASLQLLPDGPVVPFTKDVTIGRGSNAGFRIDSSRIDREHASVTFRGGRYFLRDLQSSYGTNLVRHGVPFGRIIGETELRHGDVIATYHQVRFSLETPLADALERQLAKAVAEKPAERGRWNVYADRLLELGDARGERIVRNTTGWKWPGRGIGAYFASDSVSLKWAHGHIVAAALGEPQSGYHSPRLEHCVQALIHEPIAQFITDLQVLFSEPAPQRHEALVRQLEAARLLALRRLVDPPFNHRFDADDGT